MVKQSKCASEEKSADNTSWVAGEVAGCNFADARLGKRLTGLLQKLGDKVGSSVPIACQDWANTKAAYRFFDNSRVDEHKILAGHFQSTRDRVHATGGPVLVLHDTTEFSFMRNQPELVGLSGGSVRRNGQAVTGKKCGLLMHSSLVLTAGGLPLGLSAIKFWSRPEKEGTAAQKKIASARLPIEDKESLRWLENLQESTERLAIAERCVHIGDRESDIYELFCKASELGTRFLVRSRFDRRTGRGEQTIAEEMAQVAVQGLHRIEFRGPQGQWSDAVLEIKYGRVKVLTPSNKRKDYPDLELTVVHAKECDTPQGRTPIEWKLITNLPVDSPAQAIEKIDWYAMRWKIETFHKILKSGCRSEDSRMETAQRLTNLIAIYCIVSWRIFWMTMVNRVEPDASPSVAFTELEIEVLDKVRPGGRGTPGTLAHYLNKLARLGGYLNRNNDGPPGPKIFWSGLTRLHDIVFGVQIANETCG
jgi:hypothetical protein